MSPNSCSWLPLGRSAKLFMLCGNTVRNLSHLSWSMCCRAKVFRVTASRTDLIVSPTSTDWSPFSAFAKSSTTFIILYDDFTNVVWTFWREQSAFLNDGMAPCRMVNISLLVGSTLDRLQEGLYLSQSRQVPLKGRVKHSAISGGKVGAFSSTGRAISWLNAANWLSPPSASDMRCPSSATEAWMEGCHPLPPLPVQ